MYITLDLGQLDPSLLPNSTSYKLIVSFQSVTWRLDHLIVRTRVWKLRLHSSKLVAVHSRETMRVYLGQRLFYRILRSVSLSRAHAIVPYEREPTAAASSRTLQPVATTGDRIRFKEVHLVPKNYPGDPRGVEDDDNGNGNARPKTLGGVSREKTAAFFPIASKEPGLIQQPAPKGKRRWHKRPEGYHTDEEEGRKGPMKSGTAKGGNAGDTEGTQDPEQEDQEMTAETDGKEGP